MADAFTDVLTKIASMLGVSLPGNGDDKFKQWLSTWQKLPGSPDPNTYDYKAAFQAGIKPYQDESGKWKWPSKYIKTEALSTHPSQSVDQQTKSADAIIEQ